MGSIPNGGSDVFRIGPFQWAWVLTETIPGESHTDIVAQGITRTKQGAKRELRRARRHRRGARPHC